MKNIVRFFKDEEGVTAIEYGLLAALTVAAIAVPGDRALQWPLVDRPAVCPVVML